MIVMKFGGSSISDAERIRRVGRIVKGRLKERPVIVVSAFRGVTDDLLSFAEGALSDKLSLFDKILERHFEAADQLGVDRAPLEPLLAELNRLVQGIALLKELTPRTLDTVASFGERLSTRIISAYFTKAGIPSEPYDAFSIGLVTDERFGGANPLPEAYPLIRRRLGGKKKLPVVTGYIGRTKTGEITTLGRNGSDYSATILGAGLGAKRIEIWSDTDGVLTADPRLVPSAKPLDVISFEEAGELAYYGGRVLHPHTLLPAMRKNIPVRVLNSFKPDHPGTTILPHIKNPKKGIKSIAFKKHQFIVTVSSARMLLGSGFLGLIFDVFARHEIVINMVTTSEVTVSVTTDSPRRLDAAVRELQKDFEVTVEKDKAIVCVVGEGLRSTPGVAGDVFSAVKQAGVNVLMISQGASKINVAFVIDNDGVGPAVQAVHRKFFGT